MQGDLKTADSDDHNAGREQEFAQPRRFAGLHFAACAAARSPAPPRPETGLVVRRRGGLGRLSGLGGAPRRGDEVLSIGRRDELGR